MWNPLRDLGAARRPWSAFLALSVLFLAAWASTSADHAEDAAAAVEMTEDFRYSPAAVEIQVGETVTWTNTSSVVHTVTADPELAADRSHVRLPQGAVPFNSGDVAPGATWSHTFDVPGTYRYFCIPHEMQGMIGEIVVR